MNRMCACMALSCLALLAACGGRDRLPPATVIQPVDRPVAVACLKPGQRPDQPDRLVEDLPVAPDSLTEMVARFRAKLVEWTEYGQTADQLMAICEQIPEAKGGE